MLRRLISITSYKHHHPHHLYHSTTMSKPITSFFQPSPPTKAKRKPDDTATTSTTTVIKTELDTSDGIKKQKLSTTSARLETPASPTPPSTSSTLPPYNPDAPYNELEAAIPDAWRPYLQSEFQKPYWQRLKQYLTTESAKNTIYPAKRHIFRALQHCPPDSIRVVVVGQDPYHGAGQAEGLCFSVPTDVAVPSSLRNVYKELASDFAGSSTPFAKPSHGSLIKWADQGVLLLNTTLTVRANNANSHKDSGWQQFTDKIMHVVNEQCTGVVFLLWGAHAQKKGGFVDSTRHHVLKTVHPSGLSAARGFFGCKHFSKCNEWLVKEGKPPVNWQV